MNKTKIFGILVLIVLVATLFRILPYALGYDNLIMGDTVREYEQVLFIQKEGHINFDFIYGMYPVLHLLIAETSLMTGTDADLLFRFLPQLYAALGCVIIFLLLRELYNPKIALLGSFILAVYGPHVLWSMKPVRETMGLFIFPLLLFLYWKTSQDKKYLLPLILTSIVAIFTHHWTLLLLLLFIGVFVLFTDNLNLTFVYLATATLACSYFYLTLNSFQAFFSSFPVFLAFLLLFIAIYLLMSKYVAGISLDTLRKKVKKTIARFNQLNIALLLAFIALTTSFLLLLSVQEYLVYSYSWFFFSSILLLLFFSVVGVIRSLEEYPLSSLAYIAILCAYTFLMFAGLMINYQYFDPGRIAEFLIYPLLLFVSMGILCLTEFAKSEKLKTTLTASILFLFFLSGIFVVPMVYISGEETDVRSYLQYVPIMGNEAIDWAYEQGGLLITDNTYVMALYDLEQYRNEQQTTQYFAYVSEYDIAAAAQADDINVGSIGSEIDPEHLNTIMQEDLVYSNGWAYVYKISEEQYTNLYRTNPYKWFWGDKQ